jgi:hypothetical protein
VVAASNDRARSILVLTRNEEGDFTEKTSLTLKNARADPSGLRLLDMNQDGRLDVCAFLPYEGMRVLKATDDGKLVDVSRGSDYGQALVKEAVLKQTGVADVDGDGKPELLVTKKNFARALRLDDKDRLTVVDQINGRLPSSIIAGVAGADLDGDGVGEIILVDTTAHSLTTLRRSEIGGYEIHENIKIGPLGFERLIVRDLTGDGSNEFLLLTKEGCHILRPGKPRLALKEQVSYETPTRDGDLTDVVLGDLNGDGRDEFVISENTKNSLEIVVWNKEKEELRRVLSWPIFESKSYAGSRYGSDQRRGIEPREFAIVDVTGDNKPDIIILIHDRVIVYPQE